MTERIDINRLAREYGRETVAGGGRDSVLVFAFSREELAAYTRAVMEMCAKVCDGLETSDEWADTDNEVRAWNQGTYDCAAAIRRMMP